MQTRLRFDSTSKFPRVISRLGNIKKFFRDYSKIVVKAKILISEKKEGLKSKKQKDVKFCRLFARTI